MIILASKSPRRRQLLSMMGLDFTVRTADIDETMDPSQTPAHEVAAVSARKAAKIAAMHPDDVIVSADTIVVIDGKILGKPKDEQDAARRLALRLREKCGKNVLLRQLGPVLGIHLGVDILGVMWLEK